MEPNSVQQPQEGSADSAGLHKGRDPSMPWLPVELDLPGFMTLVPQEPCTPVRIKAQIYSCHNIYRRKTREQPTDNRKKSYTCRAQTLPLVAR